LRGKTRTIVFSLLLATIPTALLGIGVIAGYYLTIRGFRNDLIAYNKAEAMGDLLTSSERLDVSRAYYNSAQAAKDMDKYCWSVPTAMAPFVGYACIPGKSLNATVNSMQFRADKELATPKPSNTYRIFLTGGSAAFSSGAPSEDSTIGAYLSALLNRELASPVKKTFEVFTMAAPAWTTTHERIMIENRLSELSVDLVISLSGVNDVHWGKRGRNVFWFRSYPDELYWRSLDRAYRLSGFGGMHSVISIQKEPIAPSLVADRLEKNVRSGGYALSLAGVPYVFCLQPALPITRKNLTKHEREWLAKSSGDYFLECYKEMDDGLRGIRMEHFHYFNISDVFDSGYDDVDIFIDNLHFGDRGNRIIAERIFREVRNVLPESAR